MGIWFQRFGHHHRAEIGATNADVDYIGDVLAAIATPRSAAHRLAKAAHVLEHRIDLGHHILAVDPDGAIRAVAQRDVQYGAIFRRVDLLSVKHADNPAIEIGLCGEIEQQPHRLGGDAIFRVVEQEAFKLQRKALKAFGILGK